MKFQRHIIVIIRKNGRGLFQRMLFSTKMSWELNFYNKNKGENVHKKKFHCLYNHLQKDLSSKKHNIQVTLLVEGKFSTMRIIQLVKMNQVAKDRTLLDFHENDAKSEVEESSQEVETLIKVY